MNEKNYINWLSMSDQTIAQKMGEFVRHHRLAQNFTQQDVADKAQISRSTLSLLERGETVTVPTLLQVLRVLDQLHALDGFQIQKQISPLTLAKEEQQKRKRARRKKTNSEEDSNQTDWEW
jgi:transcriptional regulator with XRE-family HTH domain